MTEQVKAKTIVLSDNLTVIEIQSGAKTLGTYLIVRKLLFLVDSCRFTPYYVGERGLEEVSMSVGTTDEAIEQILTFVAWDGDRLND